jgi:hypothetical protein
MTESLLFNSLMLQTGFEVFTAEVMNRTIFWDITLCNPLKVNRHFGGTCQLTTCFHAGILLGLFDPEDGGDVFLQKVS